jgi:hypothetical protein
MKTPPLNDKDLINLKQDLLVKISELKSQIDNLYLDIQIIDNYFNDKNQLLNFKYSHSLNIRSDFK